MRNMMQLASTTALLAVLISGLPLVARAEDQANVPVPQAPVVQGSVASMEATTPDQALQTPAGKFIQDLGNKAIAVVADKSLSADQRAQKYSELLHAAFDIPTIGHYVIGRYWNTASPEQQQRYLKLFETLVIKIYGDRLNFYSGEGFQVKSVRPESDKELIVGSAITHPGGEAPTVIDWRMHQVDGKLSIVDVAVAGVSQSVTQRQEYTAIIERDKGDINGLLTLMQQRIDNPNAAN